GTGAARAKERRMNHPTDGRIAEWLQDPTIDDGAVGAHVDMCDECRRVADVLRPLSGDDRGEEVAISLPSAITDAFARESLPDPSHHQLWQLEWGGEGVLVLLLDVHDAEAVVAPVTAERSRADDACLFVEDVRSPLGEETVVWMGLQTSVP